MGAAFITAPASERTLDAGAYLLGVLELALIVVPLAYAAWRLRGMFLGAWTGAAARVVEAVLAIAALILLAELLGTFAAFEAWTMIVGALAVAAVVHFARRSTLAPRRRGGPPAPPAARYAVWLAAGAVAVVAAAWMVPTLASLAGGMDRADSLWYHMPLATRFAHGAHFGSIDYFDPIFFASYYPANSEVVHAVPILAFDRDILSPLLNLGWLALGLTSAYAIGRPYGLGPAVAHRRRDRPGRPEPRRVPGGRGPERHRRRLPGPRLRSHPHQRAERLRPAANPPTPRHGYPVGTRYPVWAVPPLSALPGWPPGWPQEPSSPSWPPSLLCGWD